MVCSIGVPRILQWRGFTWRGTGPRVWETKVPQWRKSGDEVPQKLTQNVKLVYNF